MLVLTVYYPKHRHGEFRALLTQEGYDHQVLSCESNEGLIAARMEAADPLSMSTFDGKFGPKIAAWETVEYGVHCEDARGQ